MISTYSSKTRVSIGLYNLNHSLLEINAVCTESWANLNERGELRRPSLWHCCNYGLLIPKFHIYEFRPNGQHRCKDDLIFVPAREIIVA
ncbi:hypothetical protein GCM10025857_20350 [Alicyclobacillus contaminans]|nr:hypothetical protein GCM10025857_20350 [Alicyclobacillus contaminans]